MRARRPQYPMSLLQTRWPHFASDLRSPPYTSSPVLPICHRRQFRTVTLLPPHTPMPARESHDALSPSSVTPFAPDTFTAGPVEYLNANPSRTTFAESLTRTSGSLASESATSLKPSAVG